MIAVGLGAYARSAWRVADRHGGRVVILAREWARSRRLGMPYTTGAMAGLLDEAALDSWAAVLEAEQATREATAALAADFTGLSDRRKR